MAKKSKKNIILSEIPEEKLLELRICDLPISIEETWLADCIDGLYKELREKGISFKPSCYLADEWLTPDKEPIIGIPFFLAHSALMKLEQKMMLDCEGDTKAECMKLLRHETGHAINYAYKLYKKKKWQKIFGKFSKDYTETYKFRPYSRNYVRHLDYFYAQYHPDEDFAETFAVWLTPGFDWHKKYKGWKAINKLRYVDSLINEIKEKEPLVKKGQKFWQQSKMRTTLKNYYKKRMQFSAEDFPTFHDFNLKKIFVEKNKETASFIPAADIIKKYRKEIIKSISDWTGEKKYLIGDLLKAVNQRCRALKLVTPDEELIAVLKLSTYITTLIMNYAHTGWFRGKK